MTLKNKTKYQQKQPNNHKTSGSLIAQKHMCYQCSSRLHAVNASACHQIVFIFTYLLILFICFVLFFMFVKTPQTFSTQSTSLSRPASNDVLQHQVALISKCLVISYLYKVKKVLWPEPKRDYDDSMALCVSHTA